jgi:hypothetical protein
MELTGEQLFTVALLYGTSFGALAVLTALWLLGRLPNWIAAYYVGAFLLCGFGWEFWWTYGWAGGESIAERRGAAMNAAIPPLANGLGNALGDAFGIALVGLGLARIFCGKAAFDSWKWSVAAVLFIWFVGENILVELTVYQAQVGQGEMVSWAPLSPFASWWNPTVQIQGRGIHLQNQLPWVLMTPLLYALAIACKRQWPTKPIAPS